MNAKRVLLIIGVLILGAVLFVAGTVYAQSRWDDGNAPYGWGHMDNWDGEGSPYDRRFRDMMGPGMHDWDDDEWRGGMMGGAYGPMMGPGMMGNYGEMHGAYGPMMGGWGGLADVEPLALAEAEQAVAEFLGGLEEENLAVGEIMIFENHAYAQVVEADSGAGAFELLVDPVTGDVYPEPGPNMMWNTEYGHMAGDMVGGHMRGMMGSYGTSGQTGELAVDEAEAVELVQAYLDEFLPGASADEHADAFPGYYTLHVLRDGAVVGMVSVNAYSGDVFPHTWHDDFVEMAGNHAE